MPQDYQKILADLKARLEKQEKEAEKPFVRKGKKEVKSECIPPHPPSSLQSYPGIE